VQAWLPAGSAMIVGGAILLISALMLVYNLFRTHGNAQAEENLEVEYAEPLHAIQRMPQLMNSFGFWVLLVVVYMVASYGYPIAQFFLMDTYGTVPWSI
jgi:cytochrome c oxidase subunit 1